MLLKKRYLVGQPLFFVGDVVKLWCGVYRVIKYTRDNNGTQIYDVLCMVRNFSHTTVYSRVNYIFTAPPKSRTLYLGVKKLNGICSEITQRCERYSVISLEEGRKVCFGSIGTSGYSEEEVEELINNSV